jgi:oligopeptide/dipeptide ABC transporter ATP-binding protein
MTALLEVRDAGKVFNVGGFLGKKRLTALENISLTISAERPSITAVAGESGSGKTTLARLILGIVKPTAGQILYNGKDVGTMDRGEWRTFRREVQAIFQDPFEVYNPFYKVDHTLVLSVEKFKLARTKAEGRELIEQALRTVGLRPDETLGRYPHQLSGGQRQRVMVARALLLKPRIIVADEPVSMVDASLRATILESLLKLYTDFGISLVYITHDLTTAYQLGGNMMTLYQGAVTEVGDVERIITAPQHPYTQLLVGSIPLPNPKLRSTVKKVSVQDESGGTTTGCRFADRCPHVMTDCRSSAPPLFRTEDRRATACYLYRDAPVIRSSDVSTLFEQAAVSGSVASH